MTLDLKMPLATEAKLREQAAALVQNVETFVLQAVAEKLAEAELQPVRTVRNNDGPRLTF